MYGSFILFLLIVGSPLFLWLGFWAIFLAVKARQRSKQMDAQSAKVE